MKFYTSYYYQLRNFPKNLIGLSTAIWPPKYLNLGIPDVRGVICTNCPPLQPGPECAGLCDGKCAKKDPANCTFLKTYRKQLDKIDFKYFISHIYQLHEQIAYNSDIKEFDFAFIVYEAPNNPCSERWPIQDWLRANGIEVEEWTKENIISN